MARGDHHADRNSHRLVVLVAIFFALLAGVIEAVIAAIRIASHRIIFMSYDVAWMAPLAYLAFFLPVALVMALSAGLLRRTVPAAAAIGTFGFLTVFALLLPHERIAPWAAAVLALGIAIQGARGAARAPERWIRILRAGTVGLALVVATVGGGMRAWRASAEMRGLAALPPATGSAPNILLIVLDTVRRGNLSLYGYGRPTSPALDRRAGEGVVFDRAVATAPWTLTSHASLFTGRGAGSLGTDWLSPLPAEPRTLAEALRAHGYLTGGFVANLLYTTRESGLARGFVHYDDYPMSLRLVLLHSAIGRTTLMTKIFTDHSPRGLLKALRTFSLRPGRLPGDAVRQANSVTDAFLAWQPTAGSRPFFAFLNYFDAHGPYRPPEPWVSRFGATREPLDRYDGAIAWLDHEVGRLLDSLQQRGVLDRTIVVVTSDHGEQFGEHGLKGHANSLYLPLLEVPLVLRYPAVVPAGTRIPALVSLRDVAATLLDLAGVPEADRLPGNSLARYWQGGVTPEPALSLAEVTKGIRLDSTFPNSRGPMVSLLDERLHYIRNGWGREELYAWRSDSMELRDLAGDAAMQGDLLRMRTAVPAVRQAEAR